MRHQRLRRSLGLYLCAAIHASVHVEASLNAQPPVTSAWPGGIPHAWTTFPSRRGPPGPVGAFRGGPRPPGRVIHHLPSALIALSCCPPAVTRAIAVSRGTPKVRLSARSVGNPSPVVCRVLMTLATRSRSLLMNPQLPVTTCEQGCVLPPCRIGIPSATDHLATAC